MVYFNHHKKLPIYLNVMSWHYKILYAKGNQREWNIPKSVEIYVERKHGKSNLDMNVQLTRSIDLIFFFFFLTYNTFEHNRLCLLSKPNFIFTN